MFPPGGFLISASAVPHCGDETKKRREDAQDVNNCFTGDDNRNNPSVTGSLSDSTVDTHSSEISDVTDDIERGQSEDTIEGQWTRVQSKKKLKIQSQRNRLHHCTDTKKNTEPINIITYAAAAAAAQIPEVSEKMK